LRGPKRGGKRGQNEWKKRGKWGSSDLEEGQTFREDKGTKPKKKAVKILLKKKVGEKKGGKNAPTVVEKAPVERKPIRGEK